MDSEKSPQDIFEAIKQLRYLDDDEDTFYHHYLELLSLLCKSRYACYFDSDGSIKKSCYNPSEGFVSQSKSLIQKALKQNFAYERYTQNDTPFQSPHIVVFKNYGLDTVVALVIDKSVQTSFNEALVRMQLVCDIPYSYFMIDEPIQAKEYNHIQSSQPLELFNIIIHTKDFYLAMLTLANEIAYRFGASCVSVGWVNINKVSTKAVSFIESFDKNSDTITLLENSFEETFLQNEVLIYPTNDITQALYDTQKYYEHKKISQLVSIPILYDEEVCGVVAIEMIDTTLGTHDIDMIRLILNQVSPWLNTLHHKQEPLHKKIYQDFVEYFEEKLSIEYSGLKLVLGLMIVSLFLSLVIKIDYNIEATATIQTDNIAYISSPYDGIVQDVRAKEGENVSQDGILLILDTNELKLKENEAKADVIRYMQEAEKARAMDSLADMKIAQSKKTEAEITLQRLNHYISQSQIKSPFDGIVVEGDYTKLLGAPLNKGDMIMKIAKLDSMYLKIKVKETDIDYILDSGRFIFLSRPDKKYSIQIDKIIPLAEVDKNDGNVFIVKATIADKQEMWWRVGMSGIAKIDGGKKTIFWIATHKLVDFCRIYLWW